MEDFTKIRTWAEVDLNALAHNYRAPVSYTHLSRSRIHLGEGAIFTLRTMRAV